MTSPTHPAGKRAVSAFALVALSMTAAVASAQEHVARLERAACPFEQADWARDEKLECGWLIVPEVRERPQGRTVRLAVAVVRAQAPTGDPPLVMLHGGPGESGLRAFTRAVVEGPVRVTRDVVIYDQRGAGFSQPRLCPEFQHAQAGARNLGSDAEKQVAMKDGIRRCIDSLLAQGIEPAAYNTGASGDDLTDLRKALGYSRWDVYGSSYGSRLAQEAMRRDPMGIRSVVMESPVTRGPATQAEFDLSFQRAVEHVFADCTSQEPCRAAFPAIEDDFYAVYDELEKTPLSVPVQDGAVTFDGDRLVAIIHNHVIARPGRIAQLPFLVSELRRGEKARAAQRFVGFRPERTVVMTPDDATPLLRLVNCFDIAGATYREARVAALPRIREPFLNPELDQSDCALWQRRFADSSMQAPVRSDIPTLIISGRYDARTPTEHARRIAASLTRAYVLEFPTEGHGARPVGCHASIVREFLANPLREPDSSCIKSIPPIRFVTGWHEIDG
jgi:pimeloyl-ACP methyl ester carboxylesterase